MSFVVPGNAATPPPCTRGSVFPSFTYLTGAVVSCVVFPFLLPSALTAFTPTPSSVGGPS